MMNIEGVYRIDYVVERRMGASQDYVVFIMADDGIEDALKQFNQMRATGGDGATYYMKKIEYIEGADIIVKCDFCEEAKKKD